MNVGDRYRLVRRIAGGGMGTVHEAVDERLGRRVAVKLLREEHADDPSFVERFRREARAAASLSHPHVAQVLDTGESADGHYIVMELLEGPDLGILLREEGRLAPRRAALLAAQVCSALASAHRAGIVHRDVKPGNVIVQPGDRVKVTDFGIASTRGAETLTDVGAVLGTARYLSPEQASGRGATPASDLYAVGVLLFQMLTGSTPFPDDTPVAVALRHVHEGVPRVRDRAPEVPVSLDLIVARATAREPADRHPDARAMEAELHRFLDAGSSPEATAVLALAAPGAAHRSTDGKARAGRPLSWRRASFAAAAVGLPLLAWAVLAGGEPDAGPAVSPPPAQPSARQVELVAKPRPPSPSPSTPTPSTTPPAGTVVPADVLGADVDELKDLLRALDYDVETVAVDSRAPEDSVVATVPAPGQPLVPGQTVVLVASKGDVPDDAVRHEVPGWVVGADTGQAEEFLDDRGLDVDTVDVDSAHPKGVVVASYPEPGTVAEDGSVVLVVSKGP